MAPIICEDDNQERVEQISNEIDHIFKVIFADTKPE